MPKCVFLGVVLFLHSFAMAQSTPVGPVGEIDIRRIRLHEDTDSGQAKLVTFLHDFQLSAPSTADSVLVEVLVDQYAGGVDSLQQAIERNQAFDHRIKVKYLTGLKKLLWQLSDALHTKAIAIRQMPAAMKAYEVYMELDFSGSSLLGAVNIFPHAVNALVFDNQTVFFDNKELESIRIALYRQYIELNPTQILSTIQPYLEQPFADTLIIRAAIAFPDMFYNYASAVGTDVGKKIQGIRHPLVSTVAKIAIEPKARLIYPFLPSLLAGELTIDSIKNSLSQPNSYFRLLVNTQQHYLQQGLPLLNPNLREINLMIRRKAEEWYINEINALHDEQPAVRFSILEPLSIEELYYIIVTGEEVLYTSSYTGVYARLMTLMGRSAGDSLLQKVQYDRFRKFIRMAAGYNRLDHFLSTMPKSSAQQLMKSFVQGLEEGLSLENAVDVADSYGSIENKDIHLQISNEIARQLVVQRNQGNQRGVAVYDILQTIFRSSRDSAQSLSRKYGIPPVYTLSNSHLADTTGRIVQQLFFYGDKDGQESFHNFLSVFKGRKEWMLIQQPDWVEIKSRVGKPVSIFANMPHDNTEGEDPDAHAQKLLSQFLADSNLHPTIIVHRGHSYHLKYTLEQLPPSAKIVVLGSCGSYQYLDAVLGICPEAHIISSKEVGTRLVNEPILRIISESLRRGEGVDWIKTWNQLTAQLNNGYAKERLENYLPPHRNLGALFIKAFRNWEGQVMADGL
ncbi:MAG: hypothetical protein RLZZ557_1792 [Bacteroidota bacterium]